MFENIHIDHFRGIKSCQIDGLEQVNLFFGKNNCGKSSAWKDCFYYPANQIPHCQLQLTTCVVIFDFRKWILV